MNMKSNYAARGGRRECRKVVGVLSLAALLAFSQILFAAGPGPEGRDEIEKSFQVRPGGVLNIDADVGEVDIKTADSDRVRVEYTLEYKVKTAQEVEELRKNLTIEIGQTENKVNVVVRLA